MSSAHVESYYADPVLGNFTSEADMHIWQAESLATIISSGGRESFDTWNDDIRDGVLFLLVSELRRARQALASERKEQASER